MDTETENTQHLVLAVREHARRHYRTGGWDYVVEAYEDGDILAVIRSAKAVSAPAAIAAVAEVVGIQNDVRQDVLGLAKGGV